jgi:hypothetical protein
VPLEGLDWSVPGLLKEKVAALIKGLPKTYRKQLVPVPKTVEIILQEMEKGEPSLINALSRFVYRKFGVDIPASVWAGVEVPDHLKMRVSVVDPSGKALESGRDIHLLIQSDEKRHGAESSSAWKRAREKWEREGIATWDFGALPESVSLTNDFSPTRSPPARILHSPFRTPQARLPENLLLLTSNSQKISSISRDPSHSLQGPVEQDISVECERWKSCFIKPCWTPVQKRLRRTGVPVLRRILQTAPVRKGKGAQEHGGKDLGGLRQDTIHPSHHRKGEPVQWGRAGSLRPNPKGA